MVLFKGSPKCRIWIDPVFDESKLLEIISQDTSRKALTRMGRVFTFVEDQMEGYHYLTSNGYLIPETKMGKAINTFLGESHLTNETHNLRLNVAANYKKLSSLEEFRRGKHPNYDAKIEVWSQ